VAWVVLDVSGVVDQPIDGARVMAGSGKILFHFAKGWFGDNQGGSAFVVGADDLKERAGLDLVLGYVGDVVDDCAT
jgi:hypothetical protein